MGAHPVTMPHFEKTFCLLLGWMSLLCEEHVSLIAADEGEGSITMIGDPDVCQAFRHGIIQMIGTTQDPNELWRDM